MSELKTDALRACADALAPSPPVLRELLNALYPYIDWFGGAHDEECPQDDTCDCETGRINHRLNAAIRAAESAADALAPPEPGWQPLSSAPKMERVLVVFQRGSLGFGCLVKDEHARDIWTDDDTGELIGPVGWMHLSALPAPPRADALEAPRTATVVETGTQQVGRIVTLTVKDAPVVARLRERMRIQHITDAGDPDYAKRTRQLLLQLDEYHDHTECLIVSFADLETLLRAAALDAAPSETPAVCTPELNAQIEAQIDHDKALFEAGYVHGQQCAARDAAPSKEKVEALAAYAHEAWGGWMRYFFSRCEKVQNGVWAGSLVIPNEWRERWRRQMLTPYAELSEQEKESDREEARKMIAVFPADGGAVSRP